jgi:hypothetical protein
MNFRNLKYIASMIIAVLFLSSVADASWTKELDFSFGANHDIKRININGKVYEQRDVGLEFIVNGSLDMDSNFASWDNTLTLDYSGSKTKDETDAWDMPEWTEDSDELTLDSVYSWKTGFFADPYVSANIQTTVYDTNFEEEWAAFRPLQLRESAGLSVPILDAESNQFSFRTGVYYQHYLNITDDKYDPAPGIEFVLEYDGELGKNISLVSKAGMYSGLASTDDSWSHQSESRKSVLTWDNTLKITLGKFLVLNIIYNIDNEDVSSEETSYEIDQRLTLAVTYKVF